MGTSNAMRSRALGGNELDGTSVNMTCVPTPMSKSSDAISVAHKALRTDALPVARLYHARTARDHSQRLEQRLLLDQTSKLVRRYDFEDVEHERVDERIEHAAAL